VPFEFNGETEFFLNGGNTITWYHVPTGVDYKIVETTPPAAYVPMDDILGTTAFGSHMEYLNESGLNILKTGTVSFTKSGLTDGAVAGFTLYDAQGNPVENEKTITGNGTIVWEDVPYGTGYYIVETTTPAGYYKMADVTGIDIIENEQIVNTSAVNVLIPVQIITTANLEVASLFIEEVPDNSEEDNKTEVLGVQELPFTGIDTLSLFVIAGILMLITGITALFVIRRKSLN